MKKLPKMANCPEAIKFRESFFQRAWGPMKNFTMEYTGPEKDPEKIKKWSAIMAMNHKLSVDSLEWYWFGRILKWYDPRYWLFRAQHARRNPWQKQRYMDFAVKTACACHRKLFPEKHKPLEDRITKYFHGNRKRQS